MNKPTIDLTISSEYRIYPLTPDRFEDFIRFNEQIYLRNNTRERFKHQILNNPILKDKSKPFIFIACNTENQIIGQLVGNPYEFYLDNKHLTGFNHYDLYILQAYRKKGIGNSLLDYAINQLKPCIGIWVNKISKKICLLHGANVVGAMHTFIWFTNLFSLSKVLCNLIYKPLVIKNLDFPKNLSINNHDFTLVSSPDHWTEHKYDNNLLILTRSKEFIRWRYFERSDKFKVYLLNKPKPQVYFVIMQTNWRGLNVLEMVDYRAPHNDPEKFKLIIEAAKHLVATTTCKGLITTSTHRFFDKLLKQSGFINISKPHEILLSPDIKIDKYQQSIKDRGFVIATRIDIMSEYDL